MCVSHAHAVFDLPDGSRQRCARTGAGVVRSWCASMTRAIRSERRSPRRSIALPVERRPANQRLRSSWPAAIRALSGRSPAVSNRHQIQRFRCSARGTFRACPPRDGRRQIRVLVGRAGHSALQKRTEEKTGGNVSELIRRVQKYGVTRMRKGWRG